MSREYPEFTPSIVDAGFAPEDDCTKEVYSEVAAFARHGRPIVIFGPSGAGKEFLARHYYNTLIETEFYQQNRDKWPERYSDIRKEYSKTYTGKNLEVFLNSIRAGIFHSVNSSTIYPNLAESILFGHEQGSFTNATIAHPGLLESIKYGVLFMDEIGDFPKDLQVKLLRAFDPETCQGRRIGGKKDYLLNDIIIICATNQPRENLREDFYYRLGIEVYLKGIDERPKDLLRSIPFFIGKAIGKRKDYAAVINMFGIRGLRDVSKISETDEVKSFSQEMTDVIADEIQTRKWPGNFRDLRNTLEASVFRIENPVNIAKFALEFRNYLHHYISQNTVPAGKAVHTNELVPAGYVFPSPYPEMDARILKEFESMKILDDLDDHEKKVLSVFLSTNHLKSFRRKNLEDWYKNHRIRFNSQAHIRSRINNLIDNGILLRSGSGKSTFYRLNISSLHKIGGNFDVLFAAPIVMEKWTGRNEEIVVLDQVLRSTDRVYIQSPSGYGKSSFIALFCKAKENNYNFYYHSLGQHGLSDFFQNISNELRQYDADLHSSNSIQDKIKRIQPFLGRLFKPKGLNKPVLILDQVHFVSDAGGIMSIGTMSRLWKEIIIILAGDRMDNAFQEDFFEFVLGPWSKEA